MFHINSSKTINDDTGLDLMSEIENDKPIGLYGDQNESESNILMTGLVMKKCGWVFYKPRQLILKDNKKLLYYDPQTNKLKVFFFLFLLVLKSYIKGEIIINSSVKAELTDKKKFIVSIPTRKYYFKVWTILFLCF